MATVVQAGPDGIIYKAADTRKIPQLDLLTILFGKRLIQSLR